jgi:hypothetical protein
MVAGIGQVKPCMMQAAISWEGQIQDYGQLDQEVVHGVWLEQQQQEK